jgi:hypothetical protein
VDGFAIQVSLFWLELCIHQLQWLKLMFVIAGHAPFDYDLLYFINTLNDPFGLNS